MWKINPLILIGAAWWWWSWRKSSRAAAPPVATIPTRLGQRPGSLEAAEVRVWPPFLSAGTTHTFTLPLGPVLGRFCPCSASPRRLSYAGSPDPALSLFVTSVRAQGLELLSPEAGERGILIGALSRGSLPLREGAPALSAADSVQITLENRARGGQVNLPRLFVDFAMEEQPRASRPAAPRLFIPPTSLRHLGAEPGGQLSPEELREAQLSC